MNNIKKYLAISIIGVCLLISIGQITFANSEGHHFRIFSAGEATMTYGSMSGLTKILRDNVSGKWTDICAIPSGGPYIGFRTIESGEGDATYSNIPQLSELWLDKGVFEEKPVAEDRKALLGICLWEHQNFLITKADRDDINCLADLEGKKVCILRAGQTTNLIAKVIHEKIGLNVEEVEMDPVNIAEALRVGLVDATWAYVLSGVNTPGWIKETEIRLNTKVVNMTEEEANTICDNVDGLAAVKVTLNNFTERIKGPEKIWTVTLGQFWVFSPQMPEETGYLICKTLYENRKQCAQICSAHNIFEADALGLQKRHLKVAALQGLPVHPGSAKWLKENGAWDPEWKIGKLYIK